VLYPSLTISTIVRRDPRLHAIYLTCFNCGPDSFIINYFRRLMSGKPYLELEVDEHTADAGIITRCEAFLESLRIRRRPDTHRDQEQFEEDHLHSVHV
jgi:predicted nucleotide-binding protein (sugar kinase/HSP70/actin superfamily)